MIEIYPNVFTGNDTDYLSLVKERIPGRGIDQPIGGWYVLHAAKEPYHRQFVGYTGRGAPKDHPEYLYARRGNRMALNMVDAPKPEFFSVEMIKAGLDFLEEGFKAEKRLLIHCNEGRSRSCGVAMLFVAKRLVNPCMIYPPEIGFEAMEAHMKAVYPMIELGEGIRAHLMQYWGEY